MMKRSNRSGGFTLVELMMVIAIMGILMAVGTYVFMGNLPSYRLRAGAQRVAAHLQYLKARAVVTNRSAWFIADVANGFFTGFLDDSNFGVIDSGEYVKARMDMPDAFGGVPGFFLPPTISFGLPSGYTSGSGPDGIPFPSSPMTSPGDRIGFRPTALPVVNLASPATPTDSQVIFLTNIKEEGYAVAVSITGRVKVFRWTSGGWR